ncbi:MAG: NADH:flavin oxidoreductase/NADH oxidase family protein [Bacteroidetes bacterium]|nr:NADH:flavin oxidoreductase/NADH oxidase family protein [Bacteroidota bacterium]
MSINQLANSLKLPCGAVIKNRIGKSAMSENMATKDHRSDNSLNTLYSRWAKGGSGLLITGNIMIDQTALGEPRNVVFEKGLSDINLKEWAKAGSQNNTHLWTQINHPGKQSPKFLSKTPVSPSAIGLRPPLNKLFNQPRALTESEIYDSIERFAHAAKVSKDNGFTGVQIHGAHGYLVSQFLSSLHNQRTDQWGGSIENRMRFVSEIYKAIRKEVGNQFPVSIKLNSADFQKGGFSQEESMAVVQNLSEQGMDLIEISGGTYEAPVMTGSLKNSKDSTRIREAYFLEYCEEVRQIVKTPLMLTGGFRTSKVMNEVIGNGVCDMVGLARSIAVHPEFPNELLAGKNVESSVKQLSTGIKFLDKIVPLEIVWYTEQLKRMGRGKDPQPTMSVLKAAIGTIFNTGIQGLKKVRAK